MTTQPPLNGFRTFLIVWVTQSVSMIGSALTYFAMTIWLTQSLYPRADQQPALAFALSAVGLAFALPTVFAALIAGSWADRYDRKTIMIIADTLNGILSLSLVGMIVSGQLSLWPLVMLLALVATCGAFHGSAFDTSYAMLVTPAQLPRANGMMQTIWALSGIISPALAATIIALPALARQGILPPLFAGLGALTDGVALTIGVDAATFFIAAFVMLFLPIPSPTHDATRATGQPKGSVWEDIRLGTSYIWQRKPLLWLLCTFAVTNLASSSMGVFLPLIVKFNLAADWMARHYSFEGALALINAAFGVGGVLGGVIISVWGGLKQRRVFGVLVPLLIGALAQLLFGLSSFIFLSAAMLFVISAAVPFANAHSQAIWQTQTPPELQGRVFSVRRVIAQCTWPLGTILAGWLGGAFNPGMVLAIAGGLLAIFCTLQLFNPIMLRVESGERRT